MNHARQTKLVELGALRHAAGHIDAVLAGGVTTEGGRTLLAADNTVLCTITRGNLSPHQTDVLAKYIAHLLGK